MCTSGRFTSSRIRSECVASPLSLVNICADVNVSCRPSKFSSRTRRRSSTSVDTKLSSCARRRTRRFRFFKRVWIVHCNRWLRCRRYVLELAIGLPTGLMQVLVRPKGSLSRRPMLSCPPLFLITARNSIRLSVNSQILPTEGLLTDLLRLDPPGVCSESR
jgi:hypothetical protein